MEAPFWDHVEELRKTLIRVIGVIAIGMALCFYNYEALFSLLTSPLEDSKKEIVRQEVHYERIWNDTELPMRYKLSKGELIPALPTASEATIEPHSYLLVESLKPSKLLILGPIEGMLIVMKTCFWTGLAITSPLWLFLVLSFLTPALDAAHKTLLFPFLALSLLMMGLGVLFAFYCTLPVANHYLTFFNESIGENFWTLSHYLDYTVVLLLANGIAFECAVILLFLVHLNILTPDAMAKKRRHMIVGAFVLGALLTPPDVLTQVMLAVPLMVLYEAIIIYGRIRSIYTAKSLLPSVGTE